MKTVVGRSVMLRQARFCTAGTLRHDWTLEEVDKLYKLPLLDLLHKAATVHRENFDSNEVQQATLLSLKTGGCSEDCGYCSQSVSHKTFVKPTPMLTPEEVLENARKAKAAGSTRFCMGTAWRGVGKKNSFNKVLQMVKDVSSLGLETCCTLGLLDAKQAVQLREAGLTAYNHNLDTSRSHYKNVVSTRTYEDRLETIANVRAAGISVCCGGILGINEEEHDRVSLIHTLATMPEHPESVPINALVPVKGTPLGDKQLAKGQKVTWVDMIRAISVARITMPKSMVRLSAGRSDFSVAEQALMFYAGANSIFTGDKLLTTPNPEFSEDAAMFELLGLKGKVPYTGATAKFRPEAWADVGEDEPVVLKTRVAGVKAASA
eukprot:TRINITY_DN3481_c3_g1_i1.p1 TRINITY_DN3481_c3_g1~~TRINITY_DN3481_c3_g1_i1.p1  ORF type:complete len:392 (+),score=109.76 TRINITY_DN3481_c3_g1_i1:48-1178(+)